MFILIGAVVLTTYWTDRQMDSVITIYPLNSLQGYKKNKRRQNVVFYLRQVTIAFIFLKNCSRA
jgi:hypothetical protein